MGRRAHGYKPLFRLNNTTVVEHVMHEALSVCSQVRIVGGSHFDQLSNHLQIIDARIKLINNKDWLKGGMFSSVQAGLNACTGPALIHPVDIPGSGSEIYHKLVQVFAGERYGVYRPIYNGQAGHPVLISAATVRLVQQASPDKTLRKVLSPLQKRDVEVDDELILLDFNTLEEFETLKQKILAR